MVIFETPCGQDRKLQLWQCDDHSSGTWFSVRYWYPATNEITNLLTGNDVALLLEFYQDLKPEK